MCWPNLQELIRATWKGEVVKHPAFSFSHHNKNLKPDLNTEAKQGVEYFVY